MTHSDKKNALGTLILAVLLIVVMHHWPGNSVRLTIGFLLVMFSLTFWTGRAFAAPWLVESNQDRIVCCKPLILRLLWGFFALLMCMLMWLTKLDPFSLAFFGLLLFLFLFFASYYRLRLNLTQREYAVTRGFGPFTRTTSGKVDGGTIIAVGVNKGQSQVQFRPLGHRRGMPLICPLQSSNEVRENAARIADLLGLGMEEKGNL